MVQNQNQREQATEQGQTDLLIGNAPIAGFIALTESETLVPGSPLKLADIGSGVPRFLLATGDDDAIFGYLVRNFKDQSFVAGDHCEVSFALGVMWMTAGAAIARGAVVESDVSEVEVITLSTNPAVGIALDKATAQGDLIRILILTPGAPASAAFTTLTASGAVAFSDTLGVAGITTLAALLNADGGIAVDTNKFLVSVAGVVSIASTLGVTGITTLVALLNADGGIAVDTDKFTVSAIGNTVIDGTLVVDKTTTHTGIVIDDVLDYNAGAGAMGIAKPVIALTTGGAEALSIPDGVEGQRLTIKMVSDGGDGTLTPDNFGDGATLTFDNTDAADLIFLGSNWWLVGTPTATLA